MAENETIAKKVLLLADTEVTSDGSMGCGKWDAEWLLDELRASGHLVRFGDELEEGAETGTADQLLYSAIASERPLDPRLALAGLCGPQARKLAREREEALTWADVVVAVLPFRGIEPWVQLGYALALGTHVIVFLAEDVGRKPPEHPVQVCPMVAKASGITNDRQTVIDMLKVQLQFMPEGERVFRVRDHDVFTV